MNLVKPHNVVGALAAVGLYAFGWKRLAALVAAGDVLDVIGRQVSEDYVKATAGVSLNGVVNSQTFAQAVDTAVKLRSAGII